MAQVSGQDGAEGLGGAVHEVGAGAAVAVEIDEAGGHQPAVEVDLGGSARGLLVGGGTGGGDAAGAVDQEAALLDAVGQNQGAAAQQRRHQARPQKPAAARA